jgi:competence protein ComEC
MQVSWRLWHPGDKARVRLTVLDVGQGEALHLAVPGRGHVLVDAGGMLGDGADMGQRVILPFLWHEWVNRLDVVVLTHPDSDHTGGAPAVLRSMSVGEVWTGPSPAVSPTDVWIQEYLRHRRIPHRVVAAGDPPLPCGRALVRVIHPSLDDTSDQPLDARRGLQANDRSLVLRIELGSQALLLTGDLEQDGEAALVRSGENLRAQVLKVPHHGSRRSSTGAFIRAVGPHDAVISVGYRNRFRHPHAEVLARYEAADVRVWRTDRDGAISVEMRSDETQVWGRREHDNVK